MASDKKMRIVKLFQSQGIIEVAELPEGVELEIMDYDVEDYGEPADDNVFTVLKDKEGDEFIRRNYSHRLGQPEQIVMEYE